MLHLAEAHGEKRKLGQQGWHESWSPDGLQHWAHSFINLTPLRRKTSGTERLKTKQKPALKPTLPYVTNLEGDQGNFSFKIS